MPPGPMSDNGHVCGDSGGWAKTQDRPCRRPVSEEGGRCPQHPREGEPADAGRPKIELTDEQIDLIEELAGFGLTQEEISRVLPMAERTLQSRIREDERFSAAYSRGRARAKADAARRYHHIAFDRGVGLGLEDDESVSISEQRKALEKILGSDLSFLSRERLEISGPGGGPVEVTQPLSPEQKLERIQQLLRAAGGEEAGESAEGGPPVRLAGNGAGPPG